MTPFPQVLKKYHSDCWGTGQWVKIQARMMEVWSTEVAMEMEKSTHSGLGLEQLGIWWHDKKALLSFSQMGKSKKGTGWRGRAGQVWNVLFERNRFEILSRRVTVGWVEEESQVQGGTELREEGCDFWKLKWVGPGAAGGLWLWPHLCNTRLTGSGEGLADYGGTFLQGHQQLEDPGDGWEDSGEKEVREASACPSGFCKRTCWWVGLPR